MEAAEKIRQAVADVGQLRLQHQSDPALQASVQAIKRFQARRFAGTYSDLLADPRYEPAARFFLDELYSDRDYSERDAQFSRIAGALQKTLPDHVTCTAVSLAELHALTEKLDHEMALSRLNHDEASEVQLYARCWTHVGQRPARTSQLQTVLDLGNELAKLTRTPGLRLMLRMMRGPASAAGLGALQRFLETGFDTFASLAKQPGGVKEFLDTIEARESQLIDALFKGPAVTCETTLETILGQAR